MGKWTRRDLVKAGLVASAGVMTGSDLLAGRRASPSKGGRSTDSRVHGAYQLCLGPTLRTRCASGCCWTTAGVSPWAMPTIRTRISASAS